MKILHTSDWHLGHSLYSKKRYPEFIALLDWLVETIEKEKIDLLLVAGDIFDVTMPPNQAQQLYYNFLFHIAHSSCHHVVIIAGNHDSPSLLNAPKELLKILNVYVVGAISDNPADEIIPILNFQDGNLDIENSVIICAVPYLRDKDLRFIEPSETIENKNLKLVKGIKKHYAEVIAIAEKKRLELLQQFPTNSSLKIPIIAMGHLFITGGTKVNSDEKSSFYIGSLIQVDTSIFSSLVNYVALGHLHIPQTVAAQKHIRYSGSLIPISFKEAAHTKQVVIIENLHQDPKIINYPVPCFQKLIQIKGSLDVIIDEIEQLKQQNSSAWLEIEYTGSQNLPYLRETLEEQITDSQLEIIHIINKQILNNLIKTQKNETLAELNIYDVFNRCLDAFEIPEEEQEEFQKAYQEIVKSLQEEDSNAE